MKKELAVFTLALGMASTAPAFAGGEKITPKKQPVKMTEQQLDKVAGGQLIEVDIEVEDVRIIRDVNVAAQAAVAVLSAHGVIFRRSSSSSTPFVSGIS